MSISRKECGLGWLYFFPVLAAKDYFPQKSGEEFHIEERIREVCVETHAVRVLPREIICN
jgi:hypothetical protein